MRLLCEYKSASEARHAAEFLRHHGIAVHLPDPGFGFGGRNAGLIRNRLWVLLDEQFDDAESLLDNPEHVVQQPLDPETVAALMDEGSEVRSLALGQIAKGALIAAIGIAALTGIVLVTAL